MAIVSPNSARFLTSYFGVSGFGRILVPINFRLSSAEIAYIVEHSGASVLLYDPDLTDVVADIPVAHRFALDGVDDAELFAAGTRAGAGPREWAGDEDDIVLGELHLGHDRPPERGATHPSQLLDQRGDLRLAYRRE